MPETAGSYGWTVPTTSDEPNVPSDIKTLATAISATLAGTITDLINADTTDWLDAATAGFVANKATLAAGSVVRKVHGVVFFYGSGVLSQAISAGNPTNVALWDMPTTGDWAPSQSNGTLGVGPTGSMWQGYASTVSIMLVAADLGFSSGDTISCVGSWAL